MRFFLTLLIFLTALPSFSITRKFRPENEETANLLATLDSVLARTDELTTAKEMRIEQLRKKISPHMNDEERLWLNKMLYEEYTVFKTDSAINYANQNIAIARRLGRTSLEEEWETEKAFLLAAQGLLYEAQKTLEDIDIHAIDPKDTYLYYETGIYIYSHLSQYMRQSSGMTAGYDSITADLNRQALQHVTPANPSYYIMKCATLSGPSDAEWPEVGKKLKERLDKSPLNTRESAIIAYTLSRMCEREGNDNTRMNYLIRSAIADVRSCNRDIASLKELSEMLYQQGDVERAYACINHCLRAALLYPNRVRVFNILSVLNKIQQTTEQKNIRQKQTIRNAFIVLGVLCLMLLLLAVWAYIQFFRLKRAHANAIQSKALLKSHMDELQNVQKELSRVNQELSLSNEKMRQSNEQLAEANYVKEEYVGYVFSICSGYLTKIEEFRKEIDRKLKVGKIDEVRAYIQKPQIGQKELQEFYHRFDTTFLHIYPDFVEDFNTLLRPEERIVLKQGELLNTNLRIYALVRLGINDSVKIAEFLHMSAQTVYNNRQKVRSCALDAKDIFIEKVRQLGKNQPV